MTTLNKLIAKELRILADKFEANTTDATEDQLLDIMSSISHIRMSKEQAAEYLNMPINTFNMYVSLGKIPKGRKEKGYKELTWYRDEPC